MPTSPYGDNQPLDDFLVGLCAQVSLQELQRVLNQTQLYFMSVNPTGLPENIGMVLLPAVSAWAAIVLFADEFVKPDLRPFRMEFHFEVFGPWLGEDLGIVNRHLIGDRVAVRKPQTLDRMEGVTMHPILSGIGIVVIVQRPTLEVRAVNDERIALPMSH